MQRELLPLHRLAQIRLQGQVLGRPGADRFLEELDAVLTRFLGVVHGRVGILDERLRARGVDRENADADARRQRYLLLREGERPLESRLDAPRHLLCRVHRREPRQRQGELVGAGARHPVAHVLRADVIGRDVGPLCVPHAQLQAVGDVLQKGISHGLALGVVDSRKIIHIEHQYRDAALAGRRPRDVLLQHLQQSDAVGQRRERIVVRRHARARRGRRRSRSCRA